MFSGLFLILSPLLFICCKKTLPDMRMEAKIYGLASFARDSDGREGEEDNILVQLNTTAFLCTAMA